MIIDSHGELLEAMLSPNTTTSIGRNLKLNISILPINRYMRKQCISSRSALFAILTRIIGLISANFLNVEL